MGYACPVCKTPQADARHLANHLAFTALLGNEDHESWLSEYTPGWDEEGEAELADRVVEHAFEVEYPQVFEDTTDHHDDAHDEPRPGDLFDDPDFRGPSRGAESVPDPDPEIAEAIREARELMDDDENE